MWQKIAGIYPKLGNLDCRRPSDFTSIISLVRKSSVVETGRHYGVVVGAKFAGGTKSAENRNTACRPRSNGRICTRHPTCSRYVA